MTIPSAEIHTAHLADVLHTGLEHFCLFIDTMSIDVSRLAAKASLLGCLFGLQMLGVLGLFPHSFHCVSHMFHLHLSHLFRCFIADVRVCTHRLTLDLKTEESRFLILKVVCLRLILRESFQALE